MTNPVALRAPNQDIAKDLNGLLVQSKESFEQLKQKFQVLSPEKSLKTEKSWNIAYVAGALVLAALAAFAYTQSRSAVAIGLGVVVALPLYHSRVQVTVPTDDEKQLRERIKTTFSPIKSELRTAWEVASNLIAGVNNTTYQSVEEANANTPKICHTYLRETWFSAEDPFSKATEEEKPWRNSFKELLPIAEQFIGVNVDELAKDQTLHTEVYNQLLQLHEECARLVCGTAPRDHNIPYVENKMVGEGTEAKLVSQPWPAPPLKV